MGRWERLRRLAWGVPLTVALLLVPYGRHGLPVGGYSWAVCGLAAGVVLFTLLRRSRLGIIFVAGPILALLAAPEVVLPVSCHSALFDDRGGRSGFEIEPIGLRFGRDGPNTDLLELYLGPLPPRWRHANVVPGVLVKVRDGNERVMTRLLHRRTTLAATLALLPSDRARVHVLRCLTDPENRLRVHQSLLLTCLHSFGHPQGYDSVVWWDKHCTVFQPESDARRAAHTAWGWRDAAEAIAPLMQPGVIDERANAIQSQLLAVQYQEQGSWGGHPDFGEAMFALEERWHGEGKLPRVVSNVVWWPERRGESRSQ